MTQKLRCSGVVKGTRPAITHPNNVSCIRGAMESSDLRPASIKSQKHEAPIKISTLREILNCGSAKFKCCGMLKLVASNEVSGNKGTIVDTHKHSTAN